MQHLILRLMLLVILSSALLCRGQNWVNKADVPQSVHLNGARSFGVAALGETFYVVGGLNWPSAIANVLEYDSVSNAWTNRANMSSPRYAPAAVALNGKIYALGGQNNSGALASMEAYDPLSALLC
jgi:hypothetical protein